MRQLPNQIAKITWQHATAAANTAVIVTLPATADVMHVLAAAHVSYSGAPTGGKLTIAVGAAPTTIYEVDISAAVPPPFNFAGGPDCFGVHGSKVNEQMVITLAAGGAGVVGKLNIGTA